MDNRLISMDPSFIKHEQIAFLGDIISSSRELMIDKIIKLKTFIINVINKSVTGEAKLS